MYTSFLVKMLSKTMGSPLAFEYRREELKMMGGACDDDDVAESYIGEQKNKYREISGYNV